MRLKHLEPKGIIFRNSTVQFAVFFFVVLLFSNLDAMVDCYIHPDLSYMNKEHIIVGGATGIVCAVLFGLILLYTRYLEKALTRIKILESILRICAHCKKIHIPGNGSDKMASWQPIDFYITEHTNTKFSHGICPDCMKKFYPEFSDELEINKDAQPERR